jgi:hypothetical protein
MELVYCMDPATDMSLKLQERISQIEERVKYFQEQAIGAERDFKEVLSAKAQHEKIGSMGV